MNQYVYILICNEQIRLHENIYKIGRTTNLRTRLRGYPKGSKYLFTQKVDDNKLVEKSLIKKFKEKFIQRLEKGNEYFEGEFKELKCEFEEVVKICAERPLPFTETQRATPYVEKLHQCECGFSCVSKSSLCRHQKSRTHELNLAMASEKLYVQNGCYECTKCGFTTAHKGNFRQHIQSSKHQKVIKEARVIEEETKSPMVPASVVEMILGHLRDTQMDLIKTLTEKMALGDSR